MSQLNLRYMWERIHRLKNVVTNYKKSLDKTAINLEKSKQKIEDFCYLAIDHALLNGVYSEKGQTPHRERGETLQPQI